MFQDYEVPGFDSFGWGILSLIHLTFMDTSDFHFGYGTSNAFVLTYVLEIVFIFIISVLLLNMLIAMMGQTYQDLREKAETQHKLEV